MNKKTFVGVALTAVCIILAWFFYEPLSWRQTIDRCTNYDPHWLGMIDCYGLVSIWQPHNSGYLLQNNKQPGPIIAQIKSADAFIVKGSEIYLIDITPPGKCAVPARGKYCRDVQVDGEPEELGYDAPNKVPTLLVIGTNTAKERFYANLADVPDSDRATFQTLLAH
jgi:hypothetical protein